MSHLSPIFGNGSLRGEPTTYLDRTPKTPNRKLVFVDSTPKSTDVVGKPREIDESRIKVICRVRPSFDNESIITKVIDDSVYVNGKESQHFTFDRVFDSSCTQSHIYDYSIHDTVNDILNGYNGTILAYGQTGAGKSYTMLGPSINDDSTKGLIPRISDEIFNQIKTKGSKEIEYSVSLSIMEIYMEQINDLLVNDNTKLSIHEDRDNGVYVKGLSHAFISNTTDLYKLLKLGISHRTSSITNMNIESSRSHAIFQIKLDMKNLKDGSIKRSNLFLVDLAGSEKVDKTGAVGQTLKEAQTINSSLSALGNVIYALTDHKSTHIPYRDSKITRILQESLGGNSRTTLILNVSPSSLNEPETSSTLRFGTRAKSIKNSPHINKELSPAEMKFRLNQLERENEQYKLLIAKLENQRSQSPTTPKQPPITPSRSLDSKIPVLSKSPLSPGSQTRFELMNKLKEKDNKIKSLEDEILAYKINNLKILNDEEIKLNKIEKSLFKLSEKLTDVEIINVNLRKHLMLSEKIIEQRDETIESLNKHLSEQQVTLNNQSAGLENRLGFLKSRINEKKIQELNLNKAPRSPHGTKGPISPGPKSPFSGLNLNIIKPIIGGTDSDEENDENIDTTF